MMLGAGWISYEHYTENMWDNSFKRHDYGVLLNPTHYEVDYAPAYDLSKIEIPTIAISAFSDFGLPSYEWLLDESKSGFKSSNIIHKEVIYGDHLSFIWGQNMTFMQTVIRVLKQ